MAGVIDSDEKLTLKKLQNHVVKTIVGAFAIAIVGAFLTSYGFYYNTIYNINELNDNKAETKNDIKELKKDVNDIKVSLSNTGIYTSNNKENIDALNNDIKEIRKSQEEMMRILLTISSNRK